MRRKRKGWMRGRGENYRNEEGIQGLADVYGKEEKGEVIRETE